MLSSQLAQYGLEALRDGNPYVTTLITQASIIEAIKDSHVWKDAVQFAESKSSEEKEKIVAIHIVYINFQEETFTENFKLSELDNVNNYMLLSSRSAENELVKDHIMLILF